MEFSMRSSSREWGRQKSQSQIQPNLEQSSSTSHQNPIPITNTPKAPQNFMWVSRNKGVDKIGGEGIEEGVDKKIGSVLEELVLGGEELKLEEEVLRINDQLQEDELLAMESIYGDNIFILDKYNGLRSFQIHIHIEALGELLISPNPNSSKNVETNNDRKTEFPYSFKVQYLTPIILTCILPKLYPSHLPPYFTISVQWLESSKISNLCSMLDSIWKEQPPQEVIYQWGEWLHSSLLSFLGFDEEMILGPYGVRHNGDKRAISGSVSPDADITSLKRYDEEKRHEIFSKNLHECCICFSEYIGTDFVRLPCQHFFCWKCMKTFSEVHVKEGTLNKLLCPDTKCGGIIPFGLLKQLLDDEKFARWESLMLDKTLDSMSDVVYCPRCHTACIVDEDEHAQCSKCLFSFCPLCKDRRHVGLACLSAETKLRDLQVRHKGPKCPENKMMQELLSINEILRNSKLCPCCKMAITRTVGCNHMVCRNCGTNFCYKCNMATNGAGHYGDFGHGPCRISSADMNLTKKLQKNVDPEAFAEISTDRGQRCPCCHQINVKVDNNNHIVCWGCKESYCYLCGKLMKKASDHFMPNGCKQHTPLISSLTC